MDPYETLRMALAGDSEAVKNYNAWIQRQGLAARVAISPATDLWMQGIRYAEVRWVGRKYVTLTEKTVRGRYTGKLSKESVTVLDI